MKERKHFKEMEDAPSGEVYFYNYKEPLMPFEKGHGYVGALIFDSVSNQIQCHFCGKWFDALGHHLHKEHNMTASEYKKEVGLNKGTALINEIYRAKLIRQGLEARLKNLRPHKSHSAASRLKISATLKENRAEMQNLNNTCPEQLLERLVKMYNELGRTPNLHRGGGKGRPKGMPFREALKKVYGSMKNACKVAGIPYRKPGQTVTGALRVKYTREYIVELVARFVRENGRLPNSRECRPYYHRLIKWGKNSIFTQALARDGQYRRVNFFPRYDKDTLINFLRMFEKHNGRKPSGSDCKRGLLPHLSRYSYNFGTWKNALK